MAVWLPDVSQLMCCQAKLDGSTHRFQCTSTGRPSLNDQQHQPSQQRAGPLLELDHQPQQLRSHQHQREPASLAGLVEAPEDDSIVATASGVLLLRQGPEGPSLIVYEGQSNTSSKNTATVQAAAAAVAVGSEDGVPHVLQLPLRSGPPAPPQQQQKPPSRQLAAHQPGPLPGGAQSQQAAAGGGGGQQAGAPRKAEMPNEGSKLALSSSIYV